MFQTFRIKREEYRIAERDGAVPGGGFYPT